MIRKNNKTNSMKKIIIFASIIVVLAGIAGASFYFLNKSNQSTTNSDNANTLTEEQKKAAGYIDDQPATDDQSSTGTDIKKDSVDEEDRTSTVTGEFTMLEQSGDTVRMRTILSGVSSSGSCALSMTGPNGGTYSASSQIQALASSSTCQGFDVPVSSLKTGMWKVSLKVTMAGDSITLTGEVDVK